MLAVALFALSCWRPRRPEEWGLMRVNDLIVGADGTVAVLCRPKKNGASYRAQSQVFTNLPPELALYVRDYLDYARPLLLGRPPTAQDPLFCNRLGRKLTAQSVGVMFKELVAAFAPELFPMGLNPHALRTLVTTDLVTRYGRKVGGNLAADALIDHASTALKSYLIREPDPARLQSGDKTQEAAVAAAYRKVFGHKFKATPLKP